jgi:hypothetical protein
MRDRLFNQTTNSYRIAASTIIDNNCGRISVLEMSIFALALKSLSVMVLYGNYSHLLRTNDPRLGRIKTIAPPSNQRWSSWALLSAIFEDESDILNGRGTGVVPIGPSEAVIVSEDDSMDVDDSLSPSHPLDRLHRQVVAEFSKLLDELVLRVGGPEIHVADTSIYAPEWRKIPFSKWTPTECLSYLNYKRKVKASYPEAGVFLRLPHSQTHPGRSGQYWPREAWDSVISYLTRVGATWEDTAMDVALGNLERRVEEVFAMKLRPTGT